MTTNLTFSEWLNKLLAERNMRPADLVKLSGLDKSAVSRILSGSRSPEPETIKALARALHIPPETVFRVSIGLQPNISEDENHERANQLISILKTPTSKQRAIDYLELLIQQEERDEQERVRKNSKNHPATQPR